jgi:quercetin dioxygenase-like cupin family protein
MSVNLKEKSSEAAQQADRQVLYEDDKTRITYWRFDPGAETGWHRHTHDYVTIQQSGGQLRLENRDGSIKIVDYENGRAAKYEAPVEHNATNTSDVEVRVTEIEYKS